MPSPVKHLREAFSRMSPFGKLSVALALAALATCLFSSGYLFGSTCAGR